MPSIKRPSSSPSPSEVTRLEAVARRLNKAWSGLPAVEILRNAFADSAFIKNPVLVSSFGADSAVLLHLLSLVDQSAEVVFLDTGFHFDETLAYRSELTRALGLTGVRVARVDPLEAKRHDAQGRLHRDQPDACCQLRKVNTLHRHLRMNDAWISGQRQAQSSTRSELQCVEVDRLRGKLKINPLARWSEIEIATYKVANDLLEHPLVSQGFLSVGCAPCTSSVMFGEASRAGRWRGFTKLECGLHDRTHINASSENVA
ncbi:phosphoadenylyl-sulfate reductase [Luminiphilus sp.]|nr:phosphoadenylyl-sulfate reductase [Luminiphilus sp.]MDB2313349.1 phosphoadenylyl-sulfate reductase [Luminiphilus sp.]